ncbi:MAG: NrfD/PsrC family molybdoenzyme membrane anchor subunit [Pseudomonadota bacterium]
MNRRITIKTILWATVGVLAAATLARFKNGLGATTGLSDSAPWGFWIAFDVMAGVALAAGGFVLAATVYIFNLERYRPLVRPAVLTAFLGYAAVAIGLLYDLGLPWNIWHPLIFPQPHSVLFEVAMCVMLYLTVLFLEVSPTVLEHPWFEGPWFRVIHRVLKKATIPLVITGIVLSTLHQSSLGSLFLIAPHRLHPLWYSPIIWVLFFVSATGLGLMMVTLESFFSAWYSGHRLRMDLLARLGRAASVVLLLYAGIRLVDLQARGVLGTLLDGSPLAALFVFELLVSALIPGILLAVPRVRNNPRGLCTAAVLSVFGIIGYRFDVCIVAFSRPEGMSYFPTWMELAVSLGIVAAAMLVFLFFVDNLKIYAVHPSPEPPANKASDYATAGMRSLLPGSLAAPRRHSLALVLGFAVATAFLPHDAIFGASPKAVPVLRARLIEGAMQSRGAGRGHEFVSVSSRSPDSAGGATPLLAIDGNRDGRLVLFPHDLHAEKLGGQRSCNTCHHQSLPYARDSACSECHRDMYGQTELFDHADHVARLGGNSGCDRCHRAKDQAKSRATATPCIECHQGMLARDAMVQPPGGAMTGLASGYMDAMHGLCIGCHEREAPKVQHRLGSGFALCTNCHRDVDDSFFRTTSPYAATETIPCADTRRDGRNGG